MSMPSPEFCQLVLSLSGALFASDNRHAPFDPTIFNRLMAQAESDMMSWAAHRSSEIETLRWAIYGDHG